MTLALAKKDQFAHCRFIPYDYGWWDKETRVLMLFKNFGMGFTVCHREVNYG